MHVGVGTVSSFGPGQKGTIQSAFGETLKVDGTNCSKQRSSNSKESKDAHCAWKKQDGKDVLEFDNDFNGKDELVILSDEGLAVSPTVYVSVFDQRK